MWALFQNLPAQKSRRLHQQHNDQNTEHDRIRKLGRNIGFAQILDNAIGSMLASVAGVLLCSAYPSLTPYTGSPQTVSLSLHCHRSPSLAGQPVPSLLPLTIAMHLHRKQPKPSPESSCPEVPSAGGSGRCTADGHQCEWNHCGDIRHRFHAGFGGRRASVFRVSVLNSL